MASSDRKSHFPSIEKKHGMPMSHWFAQMEKVAGKKYPEQIAFLRENHGFSQAHANALVMYTRGSKSSKRFNTLEQYLEPFDAVKKKTVKSIFKAIKAKYPKMELVIAWNQPMLKLGDDYIFGVTVLKNHILMAPWSKDVIAQFEDQLGDYKVNKKTIQVPVDWKVNAKLLQDMARARVKEL
jgi:uncharacterized protein YdhG (YjbR/CyaY superfamily)